MGREIGDGVEMGDTSCTKIVLFSLSAAACVRELERD